MRLSLAVCTSLATLALGIGTASADVWDVQSTNDNTTATRNELVHGSDQLHDLGGLVPTAPDVDFYALSQRPFSSYEIVADATSGDITPLDLDLVASNGTTVVQPGQSVGVGFTQSVRWANTTASAVNNQFVRVASGGTCTTLCGADDVYRLRAYETTYAIPRFNNSGSQITVVLLQNPASYTIAGTIYYWNAAGTQLLATPFSLAPKGLFVAGSSAPIAGQGGSITITHDGRFGDLSGKAVALEPSTGFSFDSPMVPRLH